ncbi:diaminopimelate epimerase [Agaribacterium haliotis]|uniref:diaminopimelate epimerase n=1 Tax=Agaribacterium haliotis TaxID=2013869 RepID=UPI000BB56E0B|nr:diaminopimelate epimerase [Agaribacterium haliotis]
MRLRFTKMQGIGNDFVMLDGVSQKLSLSPAKIRKLADRHFGVGCDQVLLVEPPRSPAADFRYRIFNNDGSEVENCGNGARCFAIFVQQRGLCSKNTIRVETANGLLSLKVRKDKQVTVDMGVPELEPAQIPFDAEGKATTYKLQLANKQLEIGAVSMGNPHAVALVDDVDSYPVLIDGAEVEQHPRFPNKVNAGFMQLVSRGEAKLRVFERGVGETLACGTGACAAAVSARLRDLIDARVLIHLPGGELEIEWQGPGKAVLMTGPATTVFHGQIKI